MLYLGSYNRYLLNL